jgi:hypothetical protein
MLEAPTAGSAAGDAEGGEADDEGDEGGGGGDEGGDDEEGGSSRRGSKPSRWARRGCAPLCAQAASTAIPALPLATV